MASGALETWIGERRSRIEELYAAHSSVWGSKPGRRVATKQLNWSLVLRLAAEFQGFSRDLHDEAADFIVESLNANMTVQSTVRNALLRERRLAKGNAHPGSLGQDFQVIGIPLVGLIKSHYKRGEMWLSKLENVNTARNGIAHSDSAKIANATGGRSLTLDIVKSWNSGLDGLARAMDRVTAIGLNESTGKGFPW